MARQKAKGKELAIVVQPSKPSRDANPPYEEEPLMIDAGAGSGHKKQAKKRTREEVFEDNTTNWVERLKVRSAKNERQVDAISLEEKFSVPEIRREGLEGWFEPLSGYNLKCAREFFQNVEINVNKDTGLPIRLKSKVNNKPILISPKIIASHLRYKRPEPSTINYPRAKPLDADLVKEILYDYPEQATDPIKPSLFKEEIRTLNKAIHHNLYPRGKENEPSQKSAELLAAFVDSSFVADWAEFILNQMIDFIQNTPSTAQIWFPCMITTICHKQGVKGPAYYHMERLDPGVIDMTSVKKSRARSREGRAKAARITRASNVPSSTAGPSSSKSKSKLLVPPPDSAKPTVWYKKLFMLAASGSKKIDRIERRRKLERHYREWEKKVLENLSGQHYEVPPELVVEDSDDDEEDDFDEEE
ncbi:hypothetical protein Vadar_018130 [Vaccinium darrowii]|uniref:Uncharacterized protein n=1 Tax=Vaccinium darrowii TaxID=229202 RepID=A0ACB7XSG9_9ERIC|nr:hypothetical protein Vadar_018130 [Vaccinium darrowii]